MVDNNIVRVTDLTDYLFCPRKIYLKRVLGYKEEKREEAIFGSIVHHIFDRLNESEEEIVYEIEDDVPFEFILNLYERFTSKIIRDSLEKFKEEIKELQMKEEELILDIKKHIYDDIYERAKVVYNTMKLYDAYGILLWDRVEPKIKSELELFSDKYKLVGRIDRVEFYKNFIVPIEIKSGNFSRNHNIQLHAYFLLLKSNYPKYTIDRGVILYTKFRKRKEIVFKQSIIDKIMKIRDEVLDIIESGKDPGINDKNKCKKCAFYNICWKELKDIK